MTERGTRTNHFAEAQHVLKRGDVLGAFVLWGAGLVAPLVNPVADMVERWRRS